MKKCIQLLLIGAFAMFVGGCQTVSSNAIFNTHSNDDNITALVTQEFLNNEYLKELVLHIETHQGHVSLSGYVKTIRQSDTAEAIASKTPGVQTVENNLIVRK